jgi:hypothetical protein
VLRFAAIAAPALIAGVLLEFFLDARSGKRRRKLVRDGIRAQFAAADGGSSAKRTTRQAK